MARDRLSKIPREKILAAADPVVAIVLAFVCGGLMVLISGNDPLEAYRLIAKGAFGSAKGINNTIRYALPMILLAFSFTICDKCGYFNIGQEAQVYCAAIAMAVVSRAVQGQPLVLQMLLMAVVGCLASMLMCIVTAVMHFKYGASEIVIGVMLNYLMAQLLQHLLKFSFIGDQTKSTLMSKPIPGYLPQTVLIVVVALIVIGYEVFLKRTVPGYSLQIVGKNPRFAQASGLDAMKIIYSSAAVGGLLSGFVACGELFGYYDVIYANFADGFGFYGMTVALIGGGQPVGMLIGGILLGALRSGSAMLDVFTSVPSEIINCVQGFVMLLSSISIFKAFGRVRTRRERKGGAET